MNQKYILTTATDYIIAKKTMLCYVNFVVYVQLNMIIVLELAQKMVPNIADKKN